jgi:hypothetical protein
MVGSMGYSLTTCQFQHQQPTATNWYSSAKSIATECERNVMWLQIMGSARTIFIIHRRQNLRRSETLTACQEDVTALLNIVIDDDINEQIKNLLTQ